MLWNLLTSATSGTSGVTSSSGGAGGGAGWQQYVIMGDLVLIIVGFKIYNNRAQKKRPQETTNMLNAIKPGNKVKTIGGICGIVVEVCEDDNTFVFETGTEKSGKSYMKFDKQAVYQTDAVAEKPAKAEKEAKGKKTEEKATEEVKEVKEEKDEKEESKE